MARRLVRVPTFAVLAVGLGLIGCGDAEATSPQAVAGQIIQNDAALRQAIDTWRAAADPPARTIGTVPPRIKRRRREVALETPIIHHAPVNFVVRNQ
jgi:hypothetical protein